MSGVSDVQAKHEALLRAQRAQYAAQQVSILAAGVTGVTFKAQQSDAAAAARRAAEVVGSVQTLAQTSYPDRGETAEMAGHAARPLTRRSQAHRAARPRTPDPEPFVVPRLDVSCSLAFAESEVANLPVSAALSELCQLGVLASQWGMWGILVNVHGIVVSSDNFLYVLVAAATRDDSRVLAFSPDRTLVGQFGRGRLDLPDDQVEYNKDRPVCGALALRDRESTWDGRALLLVGDHVGIVALHADDGTVLCRVRADAYSLYYGGVFAIAAVPDGRTLFVAWASKVVCIVTRFDRSDARDLHAASDDRLFPIQYFKPDGTDGDLRATHGTWYPCAFEQPLALTVVYQPSDAVFLRVRARRKPHKSQTSPASYAAVRPGHATAPNGSSIPCEELADLRIRGATLRRRQWTNHTGTPVFSSAPVCVWPLWATHDGTTLRASR